MTTPGTYLTAQKAVLHLTLDCVGCTCAIILGGELQRGAAQRNVSHRVGPATRHCAPHAAEPACLRVPYGEPQPLWAKDFCKGKLPTPAPNRVHNLQISRIPIVCFIATARFFAIVHTDSRVFCELPRRRQSVQKLWKNSTNAIRCDVTRMSGPKTGGKQEKKSL